MGGAPICSAAVVVNRVRHKWLRAPDLNLRLGNIRPACAHSAARCLAQPRNAAEVVAYVTRWFNRRRGSAVALVSSGQSAAGAVWPVLLQIGSDRCGWRRAFLLRHPDRRHRASPGWHVLSPPPDADTAFATILPA